MSEIHQKIYVLFMLALRLSDPIVDMLRYYLNLLTLLHPLEYIKSIFIYALFPSILLLGFNLKSIECQDKHTLENLLKQTRNLWLLIKIYLGTPLILYENSSYNLNLYCI